MSKVRSFKVGRGVKGGKTEVERCRSYANPQSLRIFCDDIVDGTENMLFRRHIYMVRAGGSSGSWHVEWAVKLNDLIDAPRIDNDKLVLNIKQVIMERSSVV